MRQLRQGCGGRCGTRAAGSTQYLGEAESAQLRRGGEHGGLVLRAIGQLGDNRLVEGRKGEARARLQIEIQNVVRPAVAQEQKRTGFFVEQKTGAHLARAVGSGEEAVGHNAAAELRAHGGGELLVGFKLLHGDSAP